MHRIPKRLPWLLVPALAMAASLVVAALPPGGAAGDEVVWQVPTGGDAERGGELYLVSCASCHGPEAEGTQFGPPLTAVGEASLDFQLRTGRMPFTGRPGQQTQRKPPAFGDEDIQALIEYLRPVVEGGPEIPDPTIADDLLSRGQGLFAANCAPCHGATGYGGAIGGGAIAPGLGASEPLDVAEAVLTGPGQMPAFDLDERDLDAVVTFTRYLATAPSPGGLSIGGIGPVPEGFVAWLVGMGGLLVIVVLLGREWRTPSVEQERPSEARAEGPEGS